MPSAHTEPSVCAVCVTADRPDLVARAVRCFSHQTYKNRRMVILDGTEDPWHKLFSCGDVAVYAGEHLRGKSIGVLRNEANKWATDDIIVHWDDDEWSHPNRIAEQVAYLQASGCDAVGYREMLFWSELPYPTPAYSGGEAWLYTNTDPVYCLGTSLCYWRRVWEERPFPDKTTGEDFFWLQGVKGQKRLNSRGITAIPDDELDLERAGDYIIESKPRMIATIHGGNSASRIQPGTLEWTRTPEWDDVCRKTLEEA